MKSSEEFARFVSLADRVISVPKTEILLREAEYQKQAALNPKRHGPKRKIKPSAPPAPLLPGRPVLATPYRSTPHTSAACQRPDAVQISIIEKMG